MNEADKNKKTRPPQAVSLIIVILILGSVMTAGLIGSEIIIRQGRIVRSTEHSEMAYYAAESAMEKATYEINKNKVNSADLSLSGFLPGGPNYRLESVTVNTSPVPWIVNIPVNQSFQLDLDMNITYPASISVNSAIADSGQVILFSWPRTSPEEPALPELMESIDSVPALVFYDLDAERYYRLRVRNLISDSVVFTINAPDPLPSSFTVKTDGFFRGFRRKIEAIFNKYQFF